MQPTDHIAHTPPPPHAANRRLRLLGLRALGALLSRPQASVAPARPPHRILLIRPDHLGDVLFSTPSLARLRACLPDAQISYLCGPWSAPLLTTNPRVNQVLTCDFPWFNRRRRRTPWEPYQMLRRQAERLRSEGFDAVLNLRFDFWWGALLGAAAGIPVRVGYDTPECRPFLTQPVPYVPGRHEVEQNLRLCEALAACAGRPVPVASPWPELKLEFHPTVADDEFAQALLADTDSLSGRPKLSQSTLRLVAIHPGAGAPVKLWPPERWAIVADALAERWGARVLLTGSASERDLVSRVAAITRSGPTDLAGRTNLGQLGALFRRCDLVLGADSGPLHLAVAVGARTLHLYGPVNPAAFGPWGPPQRQVVLQARYPDQPCHGRPCDRLDYAPADLPGHTCMSTISPEQVLAAVERMFPASRDRESTAQVQ